MMLIHIKKIALWFNYLIRGSHWIAASKPFEVSFWGYAYVIHCLVPRKDLGKPIERTTPIENFMNLFLDSTPFSILSVPTFSWPCNDKQSTRRRLAVTTFQHNHHQIMNHSNIFVMLGRNCLPTTTYCLPTTTYCPPTTTYCLPITTYCLPTPTYCLPTTTGHLCIHLPDWFAADLQ